MIARPLVLLLACAAWLVAACAAFAEGKVALIIGNADYLAASQLKNPISDAAAVTEALIAAGFSVVHKQNLSQGDLMRELGAFQRSAARADSAVIYFAGHGMEINQRNYLIPVDAQLEFVSDADFQAVPLDLLQRSVAGASTLGLVIIDACRNNPFATRLAQAEANRSVGFGLARVEPGGNTLVAFAAREGTFALDGIGDNSPFATALVKALRTPGLEIGKMFRQLHDEVQQATGGAQEPVVFGSLSAQDYYFIPPAPEPAPVVAAAEEPARGVVLAPQPGAAASDANLSLQVELAYWQSAERGGKAEDYALYLESYPTGSFAPLARARLARLLSEEAAASPPPTPLPEPREAPAPQVQAALSPPEPVAEPAAQPPAEPPAEAAAPTALPAPLAVAEPAAPSIQASSTPQVPAPSQRDAPVASVAEPAPASQELTGRALVVAVQSALALAGCNPGPADGVWGAGSARALRAFAAARPDLVPPDQAAAGTAPGPELLRAMAIASGPVCPQSCPADQSLQDGICVDAPACPAGQTVSSKGVCLDPAPAPPKPVAKRPARAPAKGCIVFNGKRIC